MQRGTVRARSPSPSGIDERSISPTESKESRRGEKRQRTGENLDITFGASVHNGVATHKMGRPSNGTTSGNGAGPSNGHANGQSLLAHVTRADVTSRNMYPDDDDWAEQQEDVMMDDGPELGHLHHGKRMPVDREEFVRLVLQGLRDVGYEQAASVLEVESGITLAAQPVNDLQAAILGGRWSESLSLLQQLDIIPADAEEPASSSSSMQSAKSGNGSDTIRFLISRQKYLEILEAGQSKKALAVLRSELAAVVKDPDVLHTLSGFMMCVDRDDLFERAQWDGAAGSSRQRLLEALQEHIPPSIMVPSRRISVLFDQARAYQRQSCLYHTESEPFSLYTNHECKAAAFPTHATHLLADHKDEVLALAWSPDGNLLASAGGDCLVVIWQCTPEGSGDTTSYRFTPLHHLKDHKDGVGIVVFSPDGKTLVSAADRQLYLWDVETGAPRKIKSPASPHTDEISAVRWLPDGSAFVASSLDNKIIFYSPEGEVQRKLDTLGVQVKDVAITPDASRLVLSATILKRGSNTNGTNKLRPAMSGRTVHDPLHGISGDPVTEFGYEEMSNCIVVMKRDTLEIAWVFDEIKSEIASMEISADGRKILVSTIGTGIYLLSLDPAIRVIRHFEGHVQTRFLLRSAFGAGRDRFIITGSEDSKIYVYQTSQSRPLEILQGHDGPVNAVAWNPAPGRQMFASCSDDHGVRIWQPPSRD